MSKGTVTRRSGPAPADRSGSNRPGGAIPRRQSKGTGAERRAKARARYQRKKTLRVVIPVAVVAAIAIVAVLISLLGGSTGTATSPPMAGVTVSGRARTTLIPPGGLVPSYSAPALAGGTVMWATYRGSPAVIAIWAPWCPHCQKELPILDRVAREFPNLQLTSIATDVDAQPGPTVEEYMSGHHLVFPVALDAKDGRIGEAFGLSGFPTVYFVKADGTVYKTTVGEVSEDEMRSTMQAIAG
jgi:thiol-disulfide isomerase/thioredoxin